jgi:chromatin structure-remodeling complex subunit RSC9
MLQQQTRPIANLPHQPHPPPTHQRSQNPSPYSPDIRELHHGPKNRLFLALRSSIPTEVDWALPRLVVASFELNDTFKLDQWLNSVAALTEWPERWLGELEKEAALAVVRKRGRGEMLGVLPEWTRDEALEARAVNSLLVLRNASLTPGNAKTISRKPFLAFLERFLSLPSSFLLDLSLRSPEPLLHVLTLLQSIFSHLRPPSPKMLNILSSTLPLLLLETRDLAMLDALLTLAISALSLKTLPAMPPPLLPYALHLLTLRPPGSTLETTLDLIISLTVSAAHARALLSLPSFPAHLKSLVLLLDHSAIRRAGYWDPPRTELGHIGRNPAGALVRAEAASRRRALERDTAQRNMELYGGGGVIKDVADEAPIISDAIKRSLYDMPEPQRSINW